MPANPNIPAHFPIEFATNWEALTQEQDSILRPLVTFETFGGAEKQFNQFGKRRWGAIEERAGKTRTTPTPTNKRVLRKAGFDDAEKFGEFDAANLGSIILPTSDFMTAMKWGYNCLTDQVIVSAALGPAQQPIVVNGLTSYQTVVLPGSQLIGIGYNETNTPANSSFTLPKLRQAKRIFDNNDIPDTDVRVIALTGDEINSLMRDAQIGSRDWNEINAWNDGKLDKFMGFQLKKISTEVVPAVGGVRTLPAWVQSGIKFSSDEVRTHIDTLPESSHAIQLRCAAQLGATRMEEKKVVGIACDATLV